VFEFCYVSIYSIDFDSCVFCILAFTDCPGPQSDSAGKSDACEGCPNQQICATAPKGPDPGWYSPPLSYAFMFISNNLQLQ